VLLVLVKSHWMHVVETSWWVELVDVWRRAMGERSVEGWCCGVYIRVMVTL
jgi:hypothetical protein